MRTLEDFAARTFEDGADRTLEGTAPVVVPPVPTVEYGPPPWWTEHVALTLELGIGTAGNQNPVGLWDAALWDAPASGTWSGLEPEWVAVDNCRILEVGIGRGRERSLDRFGVSSMSVTAEDPDGQLSWQTEPAAGQLEVRPGTPIRLTARIVETGATSTLWRGWIEAVDDTFGPSAVPAAEITAQDGLAQIAHTNEPERAPEGAGERSDQRVARLLDVAGWPTQWRTLESGRTTVQATNLARSVVDDLGITADSEGGALYASRDDHVVFRNRDWLRVDPHAIEIQATVGGAAQDICGAGYETTRRGSDIVNDVQLARAGGTVRRHTDPTSIGLYQRRTFQRTDYICETDAQIDLLAGRMLMAWAPARVRIPTVTVTPTDRAAEWAFVCEVDYGWRIQLHYPATAAGEPWTREMIVQGINYEIGPDGWTVDLAVDDPLAGPADIWDGAAGWDTALWALPGV